MEQEAIESEEEDQLELKEIGTIEEVSKIKKQERRNKSKMAARACSKQRKDASSQQRARHYPEPTRDRSGERREYRHHQNSRQQYHQVEESYEYYYTKGAYERRGYRKYFNPN